MGVVAVKYGIEQGARACLLASFFVRSALLLVSFRFFVCVCALCVAVVGADGNFPFLVSFFCVVVVVECGVVLLRLVQVGVAWVGCTSSRQDEFNWRGV